MGKGSFVCCSGAHGPKHSAFLGYFHSLNISFFPSPPNIPSQNFASRWSAPHHPSGKYCLAPQATEYLLYLCMGWVGSGAFPTKHPNELKHVQSEMPIFPLHAASQIHFHYICSILPPSSCTHGLHGPLLPGTLESLQPLGARCSRPWMGAKYPCPTISTQQFGFHIWARAKLVHFAQHFFRDFFHVSLAQILNCFSLLIFGQLGPGSVRKHRHTLLNSSSVGRYLADRISCNTRCFHEPVHFLVKVAYAARFMCG